MVDFLGLSLSMIGIPKIISIVAQGVRQFDSLAEIRSAMNLIENYSKFEELNENLISWVPV